MAQQPPQSRKIKALKVGRGVCTAGDSIGSFKRRQQQQRLQQLQEKQQQQQQQRWEQHQQQQPAATTMRAAVAATLRAAAAATATAAQATASVGAAVYLLLFLCVVPQLPLEIRTVTVPLQVEGATAVWLSLHYLLYCLGFHAACLGLRTYGGIEGNVYSLQTCGHLQFNSFGADL
ncbi:hypothetical protein Emag_006292 [Eimeria magna]